MSEPPAWDLVETEHLQDCAVFQVKRQLSRSPRTGALHPFYGIEADEWVNVVPLTEQGAIVLVRQFRHGVREVTLEIPGGIMDPGETPAQAAARELLEETGYGEGRVEPIGTVNPNPALFNNRVHSFVARGVRKLGEVQNESTEDTRVVLLPREELGPALREGRIDHALVVTAFLWFLLEGA